MLILLFSLFSFVLPSNCGLRGVKNADCPMYTASTLQCDGKVIPREYVNDDYCDCPQSGLDEPGTSACATGRFFCENNGYRSMTLFASRVDDGRCDCCDGSDEPAGLCQNTCKDEAFGEQKDMIEAINDYNTGLTARKALIGTPILDQKKVKITENEKKIEEEKARLEVLRKEREVLEEEERIRQEEEEDQRLIDEEQRKQEEAERSENEPESVPEEGAAQTDPAEASSDSEPQAGEPSPEANQEEQPQTDQSAQHDQPEKNEANFPYPEEYRPPPKEGEAEPAQQEENFPYPDEYRPKKEGVEELQVEDEEDGEDSFENFDHDYNEEHEWDGEVEDDLPPETTQSEQAASFSDYFQWLTDPLKNLYNSFFKEKGTAKTITSDALRNKDNDIRAAERTIRDLEKDNEDLTNFLAMDFGESAAFAALSDQCFSVSIDKYTYEMCLFDKAAQKEGSRSTSLGKFKAIEHFEDESVIKFEGGQSCWKGPQRSLTVKVKCGSANKVLSATEPSMCAYEMDFRSPTACTEVALNNLRSSFTDMYKDEL